jgi:hypothetical protein
MESGLDRQIAALQGLGVAALRTRYAELIGESLRTGNKEWLAKRIAWRLQALAEGGLSERARRRASELAHEANIRMSPPRSPSTNLAPEEPTQRSDPRLPAPGSVLTRLYKGRTLQVRVLLHGLEFDGIVYQSLSAVANVITGGHGNGYLFFRLGRGGRK